MKYSELFNNFWTKYGADEALSSTHKGAKFSAYQAWERRMVEWGKREGVTHDLEQEFARAVERGRMSEVTNRRAIRGTGEWAPRMPMVATWLNGWRFETEVDVSTGDLKRQFKTVLKCCYPECEHEVFGRAERGGWICRKHDLEEWGAKNREPFRVTLARHPRLTGESWTDWSRRVLKRTPIGQLILQRTNSGYGKP